MRTGITKVYPGWIPRRRFTRRKCYFRLSPVGHHVSCWSSQEGLVSLIFEESTHILRVVKRRQISDKPRNATQSPWHVFSKDMGKLLANGRNSFGRCLTRQDFKINMRKMDEDGSLFNLHTLNESIISDLMKCW